MSNVLAQQDWLERRDRHRDRVTALLGEYPRRRAEGKAHPVIDFLFRYYNLTPGQLMRWHPGFGVMLTGPASSAYAGFRGYRRTEHGVTVDPRHLVGRHEAVDSIARLLAATANRPAQLNCFGMHEWAMVYRSAPSELRHDSVPLRLGHDGTNTVVESLPLRCTHFDAFRFFTGPARPRNSAQLSRQTQLATEQPGCLHAGMDLYKYAAKLLPLLDSALLMDAFTLAYSARELDMRASPYDLSSFGYRPVRIETPSGRADYARQQAALAARATSVRTALLGRCRELLAA